MHWEAGSSRIFFREVIYKNRLFASFGNEANADRYKLSSELSATEGGYLLQGNKIFATGSPAAKWAIWRSVLSGEEGSGSQEERFRMPIVDLEAAGITINDDWDGIGQRGTGSGTVGAAKVFVPNEHVIGNPPAYSEVQPFFNTQFHIHKSARQLVLRAARLLHAAQINSDLYPCAAIAGSQAKVIAMAASLEITSDVFQVMGARAAARKYGIDRYWRNARTLTLHDPVDKQR